MSERDARQRAAAAVEQVYGHLMEAVIENGVFNDRIGEPSDTLKKRLAKGTHIDPRRVRLMTISGKGGWSPDSRVAARYAGSRNVTLLDHLLSVARGAMVFAAMDWLLQNPEMEEELLLRQLATIAAIALLHDLDKDLQLPRDVDLALDDIATALERYRLNAFLGAYGVELTPAHFRSLIDRVEGTQAHRHDDPSPPRVTNPLPPYVALADKLDGVWLSTDPESGGLNGVQQRLQRDQTLSSDLLRRWRTIDIFDPHHPFLLDELQRWLSWFSKRLSGTSPLIEQHLDGRLFMLLPEQEAEGIIDQALGRLLRALPFGLEMTVSVRGLPQLHGIRPDYEKLAEFIQQTNPGELAKLFYIKAELRQPLTEDLDELLEQASLSVQWPNKTSGLLTPFSKPDDLMQESAFTDAALLALLLHLKAAIPNRSPIPDSDAREQQLLRRTDAPRPDWIESIEDSLSRRSMTALWVAALGLDEPDIQEAIWGAEGLLQEWLESNEDHAGLASCIHGKGDEVSAAVERQFRQLLEGRRVSPEDEAGLGRCLFTNEPVPLKESIDSTTGLYEVKKSAFSGRDGRPESILNDTGHTNVGPVSLAEHKLRKRAHGEQGGRADGIPALVSTPATSGLFGGLSMTDDKSLPAMSLYDLSRQEIKKGRVLKGPETMRNRYRMARLESIPSRTADQTDQLRMFLQAVLRLGRPLHLFRGLPTSQPAFFYFDALPRLLESLIGGKALRLEQLPAAIDELTLAHTLLDTPGLGYEVLRLYAGPQTRLAGIALAWCVLHDRKSKDGHTQKTLRSRFDDATKKPTVMNSSDAPLIRLGQAAAEIQRYVGASASTSQQLMIFKLGFDALETSRASGISDRDSLVNAVAGEIQLNLERRDKQAQRGGPLVDGCLKTAEILVDGVWLGICKGRAPTQRQRRIFGSIYRMSLLQTYRQRYADREEEPAETETAET